MRVNNKLYEKQGIHVISVIFTVDNGITKVLLVKRSNKPYKDMWALPGGALYNNERLEDGVKREIYEKTGIENCDIYQFKMEEKPDRAVFFTICKNLELYSESPDLFTERTVSDEKLSDDVQSFLNKILDTEQE